MVSARTGDMVVGDSVSRSVDLHHSLDQPQTLLERTSVAGRIEDDEANLLPEIRFILATDDADGSLELLATNPQLAIEWFRGKTRCEPYRRMEAIALT